MRCNWRIGDILLRGTCNGTPFCVQVGRPGLKYRLSGMGVQIDFTVLHRRAADLLRMMPRKVPPDLSKFLLSPMPGLLVRIGVTEGQEVKAGEELAVIEAMKMENVLRAERDTTVATIKAKTGDSLAVDQVILEFR